MKEFFIAWLQGQQVQIATDPKQAQLQLKVFAPVLAVDQGQSFMGSPSFTLPVLGFCYTGNLAIQKRKAQRPCRG